MARIDVIPRSVLAALWLLWFLLLPGTCLGKSSWHLARGIYDFDASHVPTINRMASSVVLVAAAALWWWWLRPTRWRRYALLVAVGMAWGCLGDFFNADLVPLGLENPVMGGIVSFALGHLCYMAAMLDAAGRLRLWRPTAWWGAFAFWQVFGLIGWYLVVFGGSRNVELRYPALGYTLLLAGTASMATALAWQRSQFTMLAAGAAVFLLSDLVLAVRMFHPSSPLGGDAVWMLYGPGQMLIVYAIAWLWRLPDAAATDP